MKKSRKLLSILSGRNALWFKALGLGVAASVEHSSVLHNIDCRTVVDIGANRGQFALAARHHFPKAKIFSFEPLPEPALLFGRVFSSDSAVVLHNVAIGPNAEQCTMHVSGRDDSSSLLPISSLQEKIFPGTGEVESVNVRVAPLHDFLRADDVASPALLKLDVQGFELEALLGCESFLSGFDWIYCECSFVELYTGQKLAADVIDWLANRSYRLKGMYNPAYDRDGQTVQADFLFWRAVTDDSSTAR